MVSANNIFPDIDPILAGDDYGVYRLMSLRAQDNHLREISFPAGPIKTIAGEVREDGVGVEGKLVRIYNKRTGDFVGQAYTNASGDYVIPTQDPNLPHFVVAFDDPEYNAKVYDNVMPG